MVPRTFTATAAALALVVLSVAGIATVAHAQQYPPAPNQITVDIPSPESGQPVTVTASCFLGEVTFTLIGPDGDRTVLGTATADAEGVATFTFDAPDGPGTFTVEATGTGCAEQPKVLGVTLQVGEPPRPLAITGGDPFPMVRAGVVLVTFGGLLAAVSLGARRRRVPA